MLELLARLAQDPENTPISRAVKPTLAVGTALLVVAAAVWALGLWRYQVDDTFISLRYAWNLAEGRGLVYNPGEWVEGFSNPTFVFALLPFMWAGVDGALAAKLLGLLAHLGTVALVVATAARLARPRGVLSALALLVGAAWITVSQPVVYWATGGLETSFYAAFLCAAAWRMLVENDEPGRFPASALLAGFAGISRPEAPLLVLPMAAAFLLWQAERRSWREAARWVAFFALFPVAYLAFRVIAYHDLFPNTYYAKGTHGSFEAALDYLVPWLELERSFLVLGALGLVALLRFRGWRALPVLAALLLQVYFVFYTGGDWMPNQRHLVPGLPLLATALAAGAALLADRLQGFPALPALALLPVFVFQARSSLPVMDSRDRNGEAAYRTRLPDDHFPQALSMPYVGHQPTTVWLMQQLKPGAQLAYTDIGLVGWVADWSILDLAGLMDRTLGGKVWLTSAEKADYVHGRKPEWMLLKYGGGPFIKALRTAEWLPVEYELSSGPVEDFVLARRLDVEPASDAEVLANLERAVAFGPRFKVFHEERIAWAAWVGSPEQRAAACADLAHYLPDETELLALCETVRVEGGPRPLTVSAPWDPAVHSPDLPARPRKPGAREDSEAANQPDDAEEDSEGPSGDSSAPRAMASKAPKAGGNPFNRAGSYGLGANWGPVVEGTVSRRDNSLVLSGPAFVCQTTTTDVSGTVSLKGRWTLQDFVADDSKRVAKAVVRFQDADGVPVNATDQNTEGLKRLMTKKQVTGWESLDETLTVPEGASRARLCVRSFAAEGEIQFKDLQMQ